METGIGKEVIELTLVIEFSLIVLMIFSTYFAKLSAILLAKRRQRIIAEVENYLKIQIDNKTAIDQKKFKRRWKKIQLIFPILTKFDQIYASNPAWDAVRNDFLLNVLLPLARKRARSRRWLLRFYASETLAQHYEPQDEPLLLRLLRDRIPLVYLHSINTAIKSKSEKAINAVIDRMSKMSWLTQSMHLMPFEQASPEIRLIVENRLKSAKEENIKAECYQILAKFPPTKISWDVSADLKSANFELRLAVLKFVLHNNESEAIPLLVDKLKDPHWEIKLYSLHRLGTLKAKSAILNIADCLADSEARVKLGAAEALTFFGSEGKAILKERAPEFSKILFSKK